MHLIISTWATKASGYPVQRSLEIQQESGIFFRYHNVREASKHSDNFQPLTETIESDMDAKEDE